VQESTGDWRHRSLRVSSNCSHENLFNRMEWRDRRYEAI